MKFLTYIRATILEENMAFDLTLDGTCCFGSEHCHHFEGVFNNRIPCKDGKEVSLKKKFFLPPIQSLEKSYHITKYIEKKVIAFYREQDISHEMPGAKIRKSVIENREKDVKQKRLVI